LQQKERRGKLSVGVLDERVHKAFQYSSGKSIHSICRELQIFQ
jgi:hypothetical protein